MINRLGLGISMLFFLAACQLPGSNQPCTSQIDWVDFVEVGSTQYVAAPGSGPTLQDSDLGPVIAHVRFKVDGNVCNPNYRPKDGDAAFLDPGTPIYQINGHPPSQVLAARQNGRIVAFEPRTTPS
jgi:hypothetical protein